MNKTRGSMTVREAGKKGGEVVPPPSTDRITTPGLARRAARRSPNRGGSEFYVEIGKEGGNVVKERHGSAFFAEIGRRGGEAVKEKHGPDYYSRIGKKGGKGSPKEQEGCSGRGSRRRVGERSGQLPNNVLRRVGSHRPGSLSPGSSPRRRHHRHDRRRQNQRRQQIRDPNLNHVQQSETDCQDQNTAGGGHFSDHRLRQRRPNERHAARSVP